MLIPEECVDGTVIQKGVNVVLGSEANRVLLLVFKADPLADLARLALRRGWSLERVISTREGLGRIAACDPEVIVLQLSSNPQAECETVRRVRGTSEAVSVIAVADVHDARVESLLRRAGVQCYYPADVPVEILERVIDGMTRRGRAHGARKSRSNGSAA
jgi:DNA-binding NarL/FixJ family response regulator